MSPIQAVESVLLKNYANFSGRASREEYWWFVFATIISYAIAAELDSFLGLHAILALLALGLQVPTFALVVRRLHDIGRSGWWIFFPLVPLVGPIRMLYWLVCEGAPGPNAYG